MFMADDQNLMTCELPAAVMASQSLYMDGETVSLMKSCSGSEVGNFTCRDGDWEPQIPSLSPCITDAMTATRTAEETSEASSAFESTNTPTSTMTTPGDELTTYSGTDIFPGTHHLIKIIRTTHFDFIPITWTGTPLFMTCFVVPMRF